MSFNNGNCDLWFSSFANAQLGQNLAVDIRSLSMGNAVTADPPGISAVHFNPAALAKIDGLQTDVQGILANFDINASFQPLAIIFLVIQMILLSVMMDQRLLLIFVQILRDLCVVMLNTLACMSLSLKMVDLGRVIHWLLLLQELPTNHLAQK